MMQEEAEPGGEEVAGAEASDVDSESGLVIIDYKGKDSEDLGSTDGDLKRELTLFSGVAYVVGILIGSGIFVTPRTILCRTGSFGLSLIVWVIGGVASMAGGLCFIELGLLIKKSGGEYSFIKEAYTLKNRYKVFKVLGYLLSFLYIWSSVFVVRAFSIAVISLTSAEYVILPFYIGCGNSTPRSAVKLLSLAIIRKSLQAWISCGIT